MVEFRALGSVEAVVAGRLVNLGAPKQRALMALLVSQVGQVVAVDVMLEALWSGHPPPSAMTSLQAYVANLRKVLEPDRVPRTPATVLRTATRGYLLDNRVVDVDVHQFGERATAGWRAWDRGDPHQALNEFQAGLALWRGQAYADVANAPCVIPEVARLEELRLSVVETRCAALLAVGANELAVAELEAFRQANPLREHACELLSLALYRAGRQADALAVLRTTQMRLAEELGIDPRPALQNLEREILNQAPALDRQPASAVLTMPPPSRPPVTPRIQLARRPSPTAPSPVAPSPVADEEVFVGREAALRQLVEELARAAVGRGRVVTVSGEPGIGKTSLLRRFAKLAGVPVLWGTCPEHVAAPSLWLWEQVLRAGGKCFPHRSLPGPVAELLDAGTQRLVDGVDAAGATLRRFEAIVAYLTDLSHTEPVVVMLDHLHRADPCSLRLLAHLAESVPASRLLLTVSYRSGETAVLADTLTALTYAGMTSIELTGLSIQDTQTLAGAVLHREVSKPTAEGLWARTEGNPFFLRELIKLLPEEQRIDHPHPVPVPVREVVLRRVAQLSQTTSEVLSVAAIAGRHFDVEVVAEAASVEIDTALEVLDTAVEAGLVVEDQQRLGWFRFTHTLAAETLYETTGRLRRARLHWRIGAAAARLWPGNTERTAEIARHWLQAAELEPTAAAQAATHAAAAARVADARPAPEEAATLWRQALTAAELAETEEVDRYPLLIGLGTSLYRAGNPRDGLPVFLQAMEEILAAQGNRGNLDSARLVTAAVAALSELNCYPVDHGEVDERLVEVLERGLSGVTDPVQRALLLSSLAVTRYYDGDPVRRTALSDEAMALLENTSDNVVRAQVLHLRAAALNGPDCLVQRQQAVSELLALPDLSPLMTVRARQLHSQVLVAVGRISEACVELDLATELVKDPRSPLAPQLAWSRAGLLLLDGRWREADELSRAAYDRHAQMTWGAARFNRMVQRWEAAYLTGSGADADLVDELRAAAESPGLPPPHSILAMALIEAGRLHDARMALRRLPRGPKDYLWLYTHCWALLAASRLGETELVTQLRAELLPYRHLTCSILDLAISGSVAYFTAEAALALGDPDTAMTDLAIAVDATQHLGQPWLTQVRAAIYRCTTSPNVVPPPTQNEPPYPPPNPKNDPRSFHVDCREQLKHG
jgi:DNA-binding SARP family transcriptional activator